MGTTVYSAVTPMPEALERIRAARLTHHQTIDRFAQAWYEGPFTWSSTTTFGVPTLKNPLDLWMYQMLFEHVRPRTILETGTAWGGSALWFALCLDILVPEPDAQVITIDLAPREERPRPQHPRIRYVQGSCLDSDLIASLLADCPRPLFVSLDSEHTEAHVRQELETIAPWVRVGERLTLEDTNIAWPDDRGALGALEDFVQAHPGEWARDEWCERYWLTCHPGGWLQRVGGGHES